MDNSINVAIEIHSPVAGTSKQYDKANSRLDKINALYRDLPSAKKFCKSKCSLQEFALRFADGSQIYECLTKEDTGCPAILTLNPRGDGLFIVRGNVAHIDHGIKHSSQKQQKVLQKEQRKEDQPNEFPFHSRSDLKTFIEETVANSMKNVLSELVKRPRSPTIPEFRTSPEKSPAKKKDREAVDDVQIDETGDVSEIDTESHEIDAEQSIICPRELAKNTMQDDEIEIVKEVTTDNLAKNTTKDDEIEVVKEVTTDNFIPHTQQVSGNDDDADIDSDESPTKQKRGTKSTLKKNPKAKNP